MASFSYCRGKRSLSWPEPWNLPSQRLPIGCGPHAYLIPIRSIVSLRCVAGRYQVNWLNAAHTRRDCPCLSPAERLALIAQLWDNLDDDQVPLTPAQQTELDRHLATLADDRAKSVTWATLKAELQQRLLGDEDGFDWPVDDLGRCLALAVFREQAKQRMAR
jgi:putative addiction module component (TIGR02574 family)